MLWSLGVQTWTACKMHSRCKRQKTMQHATVIMTSKDFHIRNVMEQPQRQQQFFWAFIQVSLQLLFLFCALKNARVYLPLPQFASQDHALSWCKLEGHKKKHYDHKGMDTKVTRPRPPPWKNRVKAHATSKSRGHTIEWFTQRCMYALCTCI